MGMYLFGLTVALVLGSRYVIPSDSHAGESCGFLIVSEMSNAGYNFPHIMSSTSSSKFGLFLLTSIYGTFF